MRRSRPTPSRLQLGANPTYTRWDTDWPPSPRHCSTCRVVRAVLKTVGNLYGYGRVTAPWTSRLRLAPCDHKGEVRAAM